MKEARTIGQIMDEVKDDITIKFVNEKNEVTHNMYVYWTRKNGFPMLSQEVLNKEVKFFVYEIGDLVLYC